MKKRIDTKTSRTATWTCVSRAASIMESRKQYRSNDYIALLLVPAFIRHGLKIRVIRKLFTRFAAPKGIYEYVIARTQYIDNVFNQALRAQFQQILIFGAGFDSRALRLQSARWTPRIFELDIPVTQQAKINQYRKRRLAVPANLHFVPIDFDQDALPSKLDEAGFKKKQRCLFILEGVLMYLHPESVDKTFRIIREYAGKQSKVVFDYVYASVLRQENLYYGEKELFKSVSKADEKWIFGIEKDGIDRFLSQYNFTLLDHSDAKNLESRFFVDGTGKTVGRINGTHSIVTAEIKI